MYVAEGGRIPFTRRLIRLCHAHGTDVDELDGWLEVIFDAGPLDSSTFRDTLRGHLTDFRPAFVHLDPLYPFQPADVDSHRYTQVGSMLSSVQRICADHDATFWLTAHMNQSGSGFDLKRISGAGIGEWGDSWCLLKHRETPDVAGGRFRLKLDIGSRQWGGSTFDVDFNVGRFDADSGTHDGPITFYVNAPGAGTEPDRDPDIDKRMKARRLIFETMGKSRRPLTKSEITERCAGVARTFLLAEIAALIDERQLREDGSRKPEKGGRATPLYVLSGEGEGA